MVLKRLPDGYRMVTTREDFASLMNKRIGISPAFVRVDVTRVNIPDAPIVQMQLRKISKGTTLLRSNAEIDAAIQQKKEKCKSSILNEKKAIEAVRKIIHPIKMEACDVYGIENEDADAVITRSDGQLIGVQFTRVNYKERQGDSHISKSSKDFQKMLGLGFIFIAAIYVKESIDGCILWLPEDLPLFSHEFNRLGVSLYSNRNSSGIGITLCKNHTYFFPQHQQQFITKILNFINKTQYLYSIDEIRLMIASKGGLKEHMYIEKLRIFLLPSVTFNRPVNTPVDVVINGCRIQLKLAYRDKVSKTSLKFFCRKYKSFKGINLPPYFGNEFDAYGIVIPREGVTEEDKVNSMNAYEKFFFFPTRCGSKNTINFSGFPKNLCFNYRRGGSFRCSWLNCPDDDVIVLEKQITQSILLKFKEWASRDQIEVLTIKKLTEEFELYKKSTSA